MLLRDVQHSLSAHFTALREQRKEINSPVFALEHNLAPRDLEELKRLIHEHLIVSAPDESHWLPWVVYATEIGYDFEGHEYWQTFEEKTPKWKYREDRAFIRRCFKKFVESYNGFRPSGVWANHFNIISYPITHAVLPKDFQYQLSRVLYQLRAYINPSLVRSPRLLGKKISDNSYYESKRFQQFAQNYDLVGLIAREILTVDELGSDNVILSTTFRRIIADLRNQDEAAYFVDQTRFAINDRSHTKPKRAVQLRPKLVLRRAEPGSWDVLIEIPDLQLLSELSDEVEQFLVSAKPHISGSFGQARLARGRLVNYGTIVQTLELLPDNEAQIVKFRRELPSSLEDVFRKQLVFRLPKFSVFKVQSSGIANQKNSGTVNLSNEFLILSGELVTDNPLLRPLKTSCKNAYVYSLQSEILTESKYQDALKELNLQIDADLDFVPISPHPLLWDEGASLEYLDGEAPSFAMKIAQPWKALRIQLEDFDVLEIDHQPDSEFTFFSLPALSAGLYNLSYSIKCDSHSDFERLGKISIYVRDRTFWRSGTTNQNALILLFDPPKPSFEQLLGGEVEVDILCRETSVSIAFRLLSRKSSEPPLFIKNISAATLPTNPREVNEKINEILEDQRVLELSELTHLCQLEFRSDELGSINVDFRREFNPLHWEIKYSGADGTFLNLSEESFGDEQTDIFRYPFENPNTAVKLNYEECFPDYAVPSSGGLFVAVTPRQEKGIIVLKEDKIKSYKSFSDIGKDDSFEPKFQSWACTKESLANLIDLYSLWAISRTIGGVFSKKDIRKVLDGFLFAIVCLIDDYQWVNWEQNYVQNPNNKQKKELIISGVSQKSLVRSGLRNLSIQDQSPDQLVDALTTIFKLEITPERIVKGRNSALIKVIKQLDQEWFVEFALRLCSRPETVRHWSQTEEKLEIGLTKMLSNPSLVRAARFIVLTLRLTRSSYKWDWE